ncbi:uncharacterized protein LOC119437012 isoform X8 [Dermacentor silvarum]|uniref:uncharacterized protein LOC119437012 isoform X5 n=1 Tax=Dermacentor silvarum TaxID=543639 RepID=UPI002100860B|nr:uncharacterized protein LOC119437012 isoform X5 [Dermacentor silvarum]XP_049516146.1 uncharacterized protein LOC119437012 isoform X6 [Dermacentor silvarum]XP_049516147.1 uncharacterized protein LOC119437012 isoform X7 [Dermacentor silvarum]XP_049516148.1 uncharacterized protein LOC119437012 isoform X8 [Dermacentor silvarum]
MHGRHADTTVLQQCFVTSAVLRFFADGLLPQWRDLRSPPSFSMRLCTSHVGYHFFRRRDILVSWRQLDGRDLIIMISFLYRNLLYSISEESHFRSLCVLQDVCFAAWIDKTWAKVSIQERTSIWLHHQCLGGASRMNHRRFCLPVSTRTFTLDLRQKAFVGSQCSPTKTGLLWLGQRSSWKIYAWPPLLLFVTLVNYTFCIFSFIQ